MYILFYSKHCKYSAKFVELLRKIHYESHFEMISVDKINGKRHPFVSKYNIKEVPSIIVDQRIYTGKESFKWLQTKIKNSNSAVPSESVRQNKIPHISGYMPEMSSMGLSGETPFDGTSRYCSLDLDNRIETPGEDENVTKSKFLLPQDTITGNIKSQDTSKKNDKSDAMKAEYDRLEKERTEQDMYFKRLNSNAF